MNSLDIANYKDTRLYATDNNNKNNVTPLHNLLRYCLVLFFLVSQSHRMSEQIISSQDYKLT